MPVNRSGIGLSQLPEYLTDEEVKDIADARRASWTSGFIGAGAGLTLGFLGWYTLRKAGKRLPAALQVNRNHSILFVLGTGCAGMFLGSLSGARNSSHLIYGAVSRTAGRESDTMYQRLQTGREALPASADVVAVAGESKDVSEHERALREHTEKFRRTLTPQERARAMDPAEAARQRAAARAADEWWARREADPSRTGALTHKPLDKDGKPIDVTVPGGSEDRL